MNLNFADLTGRRFGYLVAVSREGSIGRAAAWRCRCDCGLEILARSDKLVAGRKKSCSITKHEFKWHIPAPGITTLNPNEYSSWAAMWARCRNKKHRGYARYGGRGIKLCKRWESFAAFLADMGPKPTAKHSIDRYPNNAGNYEPGNCRWATDAEQRHNKSNAVWVDYNGRRVMLMDLLAELGVSKTIVRSRLNIGWSLDEALTIPVRQKKTKRKKKSR